MWNLILPRRCAGEKERAKWNLVTAKWRLLIYVEKVDATSNLALNCNLKDKILCEKIEKCNQIKM